MTVDDAAVDAALADISEAVAARVREYRTTLALTMDELAEQSGVSKAMLSKIENARIQPSLTTMTRIAQALRVPVTSLLRGVDDDEEAIFVPAGEGLRLSSKSDGGAADVRSLGMLRGLHQRLEPVILRFDESPAELAINKHGGTELLHVLVGEVEVAFGSRRYVLRAGDSLQFAGSVSHGITAINEFPSEVLSVKGWGIVSEA